MADKCICTRCGKEENYAEFYSVMYRCKKEGQCECCKLYDGPKYLCRKCINEPNINSWLSKNRCPKSRKDVGLLGNEILQAEGEFVCNAVWDLEAAWKKEEAEIFRTIREGDISVIDDNLDYLYYKDISKESIERRVGVLGRIMKNVPEHKNKIICELLKLEDKISFIKEEKPLLDYCILEIIEENYTELTNEEEISEYIIRRQKSISLKTKKKSKKLIKKYGLKKC